MESFRKIVLLKLNNFNALRISECFLKGLHICAKHDDVKKPGGGGRV